VILLPQAIGDSYAVAFEFVKMKLVRAANDMRGYKRHPSHKEMVPGSYSDDTQQSMAIAELMLAKPPEEWTHLDVADALVNVFRRDPRAGYARSFYEVLLKLECGEDFLATIKPNSVKSGGAMRAPVVGLLPNTVEVVNTAMFQASLTHATVIGMESAVAAALMTHYFWYRMGLREDLPEFILQWLPLGQWDKPYKGMVQSYGWMPVRAAITAILANDSLTAVLKACVAFGGDTDTVAAIAMPAAAACEEIEADLPGVFYNRLENGDYGRDYILHLDARLLGAYPRPEEGDEGGEEEEEETDLLDTGRLWHCTDCGQDINYSTETEPDTEFVNCPVCGGYDSASKVQESEDPFDWLT